MKDSFKYAMNGLFAGVRRERNVRIHLAFAFYVLLAAAVTGASSMEWCAVVLCIGVVIAAELVNTAVEKLCDRVSGEYSADIGLVKDLAAGAVLVFSIASAVVGVIIFINAEKINKTLEFVRNFPIFAILIVLTVPVAAHLVFRRYTDDKQNVDDNNSGKAERR